MGGGVGRGVARAELLAWSRPNWQPRGAPRPLQDAALLIGLRLKEPPPPPPPATAQKLEKQQFTPKIRPPHGDCKQDIDLSALGGSRREGEGEGGVYRSSQE